MANGKTIEDRVIAAVANCHDGSDLWGHLRRDPEAFRSAVRFALAPALIGSQAEAESWLVKIERLLSMSAFFEVDDILRKLDVDQLGSATLISIAAITFHAQNRLLASRNDFINLVELTLSDRFGVERAKSLLENRR